MKEISETDDNTAFRTCFNSLREKLGLDRCRLTVSVQLVTIIPHVYVLNGSFLYCVCVCVCMPTINVCPHYCVPTIMCMYIIHW